MIGFETGNVWAVATGVELEIRNLQEEKAIADKFYSQNELSWLPS